ncbi:MAG: hypothetical protein JXR77_11190, partial [Lentisphaeria bacterium]|nr:hypothetical protein [Lentisphaeria bacterium]
AEKTLRALADDDCRESAVSAHLPDLVRSRDALDTRRREIASDPQRRPEAAALWQQVKEADRGIATAVAEWVVGMLRLLDVRYYDSRGALLPWCVALGGVEFYERVVAAARVDEEGVA